MSTLDMSDALDLTRSEFAALLAAARTVLALAGDNSEDQDIAKLRATVAKIERDLGLR